MYFYCEQATYCDREGTHNISWSYTDLHENNSMNHPGRLPDHSYCPGFSYDTKSLNDEGCLHSVLSSKARQDPQFISIQLNITTWKGASLTTLVDLVKDLTVDINKLKSIHIFCSVENVVHGLVHDKPETHFLTHSGLYEEYLLEHSFCLFTTTIFHYFYVKLLQRYIEAKTDRFSKKSRDLPYIRVARFPAFKKLLDNFFSQKTCSTAVCDSHSKFLLKGFALRGEKNKFMTLTQLTAKLIRIHEKCSLVTTNASPRHCASSFVYQEKQFRQSYTIEANSDGYSKKSRDVPHVRTAKLPAFKELLRKILFVYDIYDCNL